MRDPKRIKRILDLLRAYWETYPYLRLGRLISNIAGSERVYHIEDEELEYLIKQLLKEVVD